ncbi:hypothetical protein [Streptomyces sp. Ru73]|uniref:hypothetical protein n=1 Tax=Streptomyces sp. Ru73 TaxID=2080748 RepID=UPI002155FAA3|nr:hypothetical protein [Streptomyces sp. Ru73]
MAEKQWPRRRHRAGSRAAGGLALLLAVVTGCAGPAAERTVPAAVQRLLDARADAVRDRDARAFLTSVDPGADAFRDRQRRMFANLRRVPLADWRYRLVRTGAFRLPAEAGGGPRIAAEVRLRYRLAGYDTAPVTAVQYLTFTRRDGHWRISSDTDGAAEGKPTARQLWDQGPVQRVRGTHSLVLGTGQSEARLRELARRADAAVPAVSDAWPGRWSREVVIEAPDSVRRMAELLGSPDDSAYTGIAAVTTGEAGASNRAPADRVIVNPQAYGELSALGRRIVLTHETTHVATRTATTAATPLWLSEGFADWTAYRTAHRGPRAAAPELTRAVAAGQVPDRLPTTADFGFDAGADRLNRAYEGGWLACRMIADTWGEDRLVSFYRAMAKAPEGAKGLDRTMRKELHVPTAEFTAQWRTYVQRVLG